MTGLPIYSPTETDDYLLCPRLRVLKRTWRVRGCIWTPHLALGNAIHAGLAVHYDPKIKSRIDTPLDVALGVLAEEYREGSEWSIDGLQKLVAKGLTHALATPLLSDEGKVIAVEQWAAHSKIDLVTREPFGLVVTDHKVKLELEKRRLEYTVRDLDPSWQLLHEAWAVRQKFGECPAWARAHLIVLGPRPFTHVHSFRITDAQLDDFERSAAFHWTQMASHEVIPEARHTREWLPPMNPRSCWQYGRKCDFYELCHHYGGDLTKAPALYEPINEEGR